MHLEIHPRWLYWSCQRRSFDSQKNACFSDCGWENKPIIFSLFSKKMGCEEFQQNTDRFLEQCWGTHQKFHAMTVTNLVVSSTGWWPRSLCQLPHSQLRYCLNMKYGSKIVGNQKPMPSNMLNKFVVPAARQLSKQTKKISRKTRKLNQVKCQNTPVTTFKTANTVMTSAGNTGTTVNGSEIPLAT